MLFTVNLVSKLQHNSKKKKKKKKKKKYQKLQGVTIRDSTVEFDDHPAFTVT